MLWTSIYKPFANILQGIQKLVLAGRMGEAIETTRELYPGLLDRSPDLLFTLKCRQFIEMVNGTDSQVVLMLQKKLLLQLSFKIWMDHNFNLKIYSC